MGVPPNPESSCLGSAPRTSRTLLDIELRSHGLGHTIIETLRHGAALATYHPDVVGRALNEDSIIDLGR